MDDLDFETLLNLGSTSGDVNYEPDCSSQPVAVSSQLETFSKEKDDVNSSISAIKQKILFTDDLIRTYQTCKKQLEETTKQLNQSRKDNSLIQAQLQLLLSKEEPSYSENVKLKAEVEDLKIALDNLKAELHGMDESRRMHEETIKILKAEDSGIVLEMKKKHKQRITELKEALAEKSAANRKLTQSKKQLQQTVSRLRQNEKPKSAQKGVENADVNDTALPNERDDGRFASVQNGIVESTTPDVNLSNLQDSVFEPSNVSGQEVEKEPLKERVAYITSTTDDSADEIQPNKPRNRKSTDSDLQTNVTPLSASKQKTLKNRMMDIKRKRAYSSFKRCPTQPQLADLSTLAESWRAVVLKRPLVRKATAIDELKTLISEYCEKHYLGNNEKLVLTKLCKLHKTIFSKKHKSWLEEVLRSAAGSDISSADSKISSASENETNSTLRENEEISSERTSILNKSDNIQKNITENAILSEKASEIVPPSRQQNNKPALLSISSEDSLNSEHDDDMEITDITNKQPVEFISEMPDISNVTLSQVESSEIEITIAVKDTADTPNIEVQAKNNESTKSPDISESMKKNNLSSSKEDDNKNLEHILAAEDESKCDTVKIDNDTSNLPNNGNINSDILAEACLQTEIPNEHTDETSEQLVSNDIVDNTAVLNTCINETTEDNSEVIDVSYWVPSRSKRVSRVDTNKKNGNKKENIVDKVSNKNVLSIDPSKGDSHIVANKENRLSNKKRIDEQIEDTSDITSKSDASWSESVPAENPISESMSQMPDVSSYLPFQKQTLETNSVKTSDDNIKADTVDLSADDVICEVSSDKVDDFVSQMPDIDDLLPNAVEKTCEIVVGNKDLEHTSSRKRTASEDSITDDQVPKKQAKFQEPQALPTNRRRTRSMTADSSSDQESMQNITPSPIRRSQRISSRNRTSSESSESSVKSLSRTVNSKNTKKTKSISKRKSLDTLKASDKKSIHIPTPDRKKISEQKTTVNNLDVPLPQNVLCPVDPVESNTADDIMIPDLDISGNDLIDELLDSALSSSDDEMSDLIIPAQTKNVDIKYSRIQRIFERMSFDLSDAISPFPSSPMVEDNTQPDIQVIESISFEEMDMDGVASAAEDSVISENVVVHDTHEPSKGRNSIYPSTDLCTALSFGTPKNDENSFLLANAAVEENEIESVLPCSPTDNLSTASSEDLLSSDIPSTSNDFNFTSVSAANDILKPRRFSCEAPEKAVTVLPIKPAVKSVSIDVVQSSLAVSKNSDLRKSLSLPLHREGSDIPSHWHASLPHYATDHNKNDLSSEELSLNDQLEINTDNEKDDPTLSSSQENFSDKENVDENVETPSDFDADMWLSKMSNMMSPVLTTIDSESDACADKTMKKQKTEEDICHQAEESIDTDFDKVEKVTLDNEQNDKETQDKEQNDTDASVVSVHRDPNYPSTEDECDLIMDVSDGEERQKRLKKTLPTKRSTADESDTEDDLKSQMDENDNNVLNKQLSHSVNTVTLSDEQHLLHKNGVGMIIDSNDKSEMIAESMETISQKKILSSTFDSGNSSRMQIAWKSEKIKVGTSAVNDGKQKKIKSVKKQSSTKKKEVSQTPSNADLSMETTLENTLEIANELHGVDDVSNTLPDVTLSSKPQKTTSNEIQNQDAVTETALPKEISDIDDEEVNADKENKTSTKNGRTLIKMKPFKRKKTSSRSSVTTLPTPVSLPRETEKLTIKDLQDVNTLIMKHKRNEKVDVRFEDYFLPRCIAKFLWHSKNEFDISTKIDVNKADTLSVSDLPEHEREFVSQMHLIQNTGIYEGCFVAKMVLPCILRIFRNFGYGTPIPFDNRATDHLHTELQHLLPQYDKNSSLTLARSCALIRVFGMLCKIANSLSSLCSLCCYCLKWHKSVLLFALFQALLCWPDAFKAYPTLGKSIHRILRKQIDHRMIIGNLVKAQSMMKQMDWLNSLCGWETVAPSNVSPINPESLHDATSRIKSAKFSKEFETFLMCEANGVEQFTLPIPVYDTETMIGVYTLELLPKEGVVEKVKQEMLDAQFWPVLNSWSQHLHVHGNTEEGKGVSDTAVSALLYALSRVFSSYMMRQRYSHKDQPTTPQLQTHFKVICSLMEHLSTMYFHKAPRLVQCATAAFLIRTAFCNPQSAYQSLLTWIKASSSTTETAKRHKNTLLLTAMSGCDEQTVKNICMWLDSKYGSSGDKLVSRLWLS